MGVIIQLCFVIIMMACLNVGQTAPVNYEVEQMRVRNLKSRLIKMGEDPVEIEAILDKKVLKRMLTEHLWEEEQEAMAAFYWEWAYFLGKWFVMAALSALVYAPAMAFLQGAVYRNNLILQSTRSAIKNSIYSAVIPFILAIFFEGLHVYINASTLASWFLPTESPWRRYLIRLPSLVANPKQMGFAAADFGVNVTPMIATTLVQWLKGVCQEFAAGRMMSVVNAKNKKKRDKAARRAQQEWEKQSEGSPASGQTSAPRGGGVPPTGEVDHSPDDDVDAYDYSALDKLD